MPETSRRDNQQLELTNNEQALVPIQVTRACFHERQTRLELATLRLYQGRFIWVGPDHGANIGLRVAAFLAPLAIQAGRVTLAFSGTYQKLTEDDEYEFFKPGTEVRVETFTDEHGEEFLGAAEAHFQSADSEEG